MEQRCMGCMRMKQQHPVCEHCGFDERSQNKSHQLPPGTVVGQQYILGRVLGQGGFGITYMGWDQIMNQPVAVKEYFPSGYAGRDTRNSHRVTSFDNQTSHTFASNKQRFLREAESLGRLWNIPQIVRVLRHFEDNGTAYIAMEYVEGTDLRNHMKQLGRPLSLEETLSLLGPVMKALSHVHRAELVHRDISPDNIMVLPDGSTKLLDFGAARYVENANAEHDRNTSTQAILKHGFAPPEQYSSHGALGPWTDVYAMCATVYFCLTGRIPPEAMNRMMDGTRISWEQIPGLTPDQTAALNKGMSLQPKDRLSSMEMLYSALFPEDPTKPEQLEIPVTPRQPREPVPPEKEPPVPKPPKPGKRKILPVLLAAALAVCAAAAIGLRSSPAAEPVQTTAQTEANLAVTEPETTVAETTMETIPPLVIMDALEFDGLDLGQTQTIEIYSDHLSADIQWTSDHPEIVSVSEDGTITTVGYGSACITAEYDGQTVQCKILVYPKANVTCKYADNGTAVTITGYEGKLPAHAVLPRYIDGKPVIAIGMEAFKGCGQIQSMYLPDTVEAILEDAFYECRNMTEIHMPETMKSIGQYAFSRCDRLKSILIPEGVTVIQAGTFRGCDALETVILPDGLTAIDAEAFFYCEALTQIHIPEGVHTIDTAAFFNCRRLKTVHLPASVTSLGNEAFGCCESLEEIQIPESVTSIGWLCFTDNPWLENSEEAFVIVGDGILVHYNGTDPHVQIPDGVKSIPSAFYKCKTVESVVIPDGVTEISQGAFYECTNLTSITIPDSVTQIGTYAFLGCTKLTGITLGPRLYDLGSDAFKGCASLTEITIPEGITHIWSGIFEGCTRLETVNLPKSVTNVQASAFTGCKNLKTLNIPDGCFIDTGALPKGCTVNYY